MNRLLTPNGGMEFHGDDLRFIQDAYKEAFAGIYAAFAENGNLILSGIEATDNGASVDISEGYILIAGEIMYFPAQTIVVADFLDDVYIVPEITHDPAGNDVFADLVSRDTYQVRRAKAIYDDLVSYPILLSTAPRLQQKIINLVDEGFTEVSVGNVFQGFPFLNSWGVYPGAYVKVQKKGNIVRLQGKLQGGLTNGNAAFKLAVGYRPAVPLYFFVYTTVSPTPIIVNVSDNGDVLLLSSPAQSITGGDFVDISGVSFWVG